jgi:ribosome biogenesis GTPase / thiamine phosphate phosphatase
VVRVERGACQVVTPAGVRSAAHTGPEACTGDWVALRPGEPPRIAALLPRRTAVLRSSADRSSHAQVLAANVDTVAVVVSLREVPVDLGRLERLLALAWESGARPVVVLTKADLAPAAEQARAQVSEAAPGVEVISVSARTGAGTDALAGALQGTVVLLGPSGVGKSTLGNVLLGEPRLAVGPVREGDGKGRHTTVARELVPLPGGGVLIDTPGLRGVGLWDAADGLTQVFADIEELATRCRFHDCAHRAEPGCAVLAALDAGELTERRLFSYRKLLRENEWAAARTDARLRAERRDRWKAVHRSQRQLKRFQGRG